MKSIVIFYILFVLMASTPIKGQEINFFEYWSYYSDEANLLYKSHCKEAFKNLARRKELISQLKTRKDWIKRQQVVMDKLMETLGPFPEKNPLNVKVTDILDMPGYRIEKIIYESLPDYFVTGAMYLPEEIKEKTPAIFYACGHSLDGFRVETYQHIIINLVKKGFVVFTIDPMGQGERYEYWDESSDKPVFPVPDHQHSYAGAQCLISGYSVASYFIWDVIRGIDYMVSRPEVDPERIGITGRSGGGNLAAYVGALDKRVLACAPECYITNYEYLLKTIGPQCAEQNLYQMILKGLDHPDFIEARAPKPTLIISTTQDFFSIQGARETFHEAQEMYKIIGADGMLSMVEDDAIHTSTRKNREAMYAFFQKYLNNPGSPEDMEVNIPSIKELRITKTGQIQTSLKGQTVFSLNLTLSRNKIDSLEGFRLDYEKYFKQLPELVARISGFQYHEETDQPVFSGRFIYPEYQMEKYLIPSAGNYMIPTLLLTPIQANRNEWVFLLDPGGKKEAMTRDSLAYGLLEEGYSVVLTDLPGIGEMGPGYLKGDSYISGTSYNQWFAAVLTGRSHVGLRARDIVSIAHFLKNYRPGYSPISCIAYGPIGNDLLHAAIFEPSISRVCLVRPFLSYENLIATQYYTPEIIPYTVAGAIGSYDLPDLMAYRSPHKTLIINPLLADGNPASIDEIKEILSLPLQVYQLKGLISNFKFLESLSIRDMDEALLLWLGE